MPFATERFQQPTLEIPKEHKGDYWIVSTQNPEFSEVLAKVPFVGGRAIVYDENLARELVSDYGCTTDPALKEIKPKPSVRTTDPFAVPDMRPRDQLPPGADPALLEGARPVGASTGT